MIFIFLHVFLAFFSDGSTDNFYLRLTSSKKNSLILGTSRSAQGIHPNILDSILDSKYEIYNYSFSVNNSSYGKVYYDAIKCKLNKNVKDGIFILTVDPWSISADVSLDTLYIDQSSILFDIRNCNIYPNYEYLIKHFNKGWGSILVKRLERTILFQKGSDLENITGSYTFLRDDGLLEVYTNMDSLYVRKNISKKIKYYSRSMSNNKISFYRFNYLDRMIKLLMNHGDVVLVRMPVHKSLFRIENLFIPDFDVIIQELAENYNIEYLNFTSDNEEYRFTDGNHLYLEDAILFTRSLAREIKKRY